MNVKAVPLVVLLLAGLCACASVMHDDDGQCLTVRAWPVVYYHSCKGEK